MTLDEWVDRLPPNHSARAELTRLRASLASTESSLKLANEALALSSEALSSCLSLFGTVNEKGGSPFETEIYKCSKAISAIAATWAVPHAG